MKLTPPKFIEIGSPLKTPTKKENTPPSEIQMKELKYLKSQLDNERFERGLLEMEMKTSQNKIENLVKKCKELSREVQALRNDMVLSRNDENVHPNSKYREDQIRSKLEKKIKALEDTIEDLRAQIAELNECKEKFAKKATLIDQERKELLVKLTEFDVSYSELQAELSLKEEKIQYLEESNKELVQILNETRTGGDKDISTNSLDVSGTYHTIGHNSTDGENLGSILELELKDKLSENTILKDRLDAATASYQQLEEQNTQLKITINMLQNEIREKEETKKTMHQTLTGKIDAFKEKLASTMNLNQETQRREMELENQLEIEKKNYEDIKEKSITLQGKLKVTCSQLAEREKKLEDLEQKLKAFEKDKESLVSNFMKEKKELQLKCQERLQGKISEMVSKIFISLINSFHHH